MTPPFSLPVNLAACTDLTHLFRQHGATRSRVWSNDPVYERLLKELARTLHRGRRQHAVLVGERGVDLEALVTEFALLAESGWMPFLRERRVLLVDARFTTVEESRERLLGILASVAADEKLVVCISGFGSLLRSANGSHRDSLLAALGVVGCQLIGLMLPTEYEETLGGDAEVEERFVRLEVPEPSPETACGVLSEYAVGLTHRYGERLEDEIIRLAVTLSSNYILHERLPGKARRVLLRICQDREFERTQLGQEAAPIGADDVIEAVSQSTGVPAETLRGIAKKQDYQESLREFIIGQDHAVREMATELGLIKAGLTDSSKPASVILFVGQTGTGKTEMAKALARFYSNSKRLRTYTLGNMVEAHSVSAIIGVPPGYVGHDRGGKIVHDLQSDPHCVFLLDEADKAHPDVLQPFLNLFDEGWIRDQRGVQAYASKAIFILTTNVGQRMIADMAKQGKSPDEMSARMKETLAQIKHGKSNRPVFAPEFLARIKRVIVFQPLTSEAMRGICRKLVRQMQATWRTQRSKELTIDEALLESIAGEAHRRNEKSDGKEGGRIVRKLLSDFVEAPLQQAISDRPQEYLDTITVAVRAHLVGEQGTNPPNGDGNTAPERFRIEVTFEPSEAVADAR